MIEKLLAAMMEYYSGDPDRIQHFVKVHSFSKWIGQCEKIGEDALKILEVAAIVHDIGIKPAMEKYGSSKGTYQEAEGPPIAEAMLKGLGYPQHVIERVCYLVGHHHTYKNIDGMDYQILVEADFLVNIFENEMSESTIRETLHKIFRTKTGNVYCRLMFDVD